MFLFDYDTDLLFNTLFYLFQLSGILKYVLFALFIRHMSVTSHAQYVIISQYKIGNQMNIT